MRQFVAHVLRELELHGNPGDPNCARVMLYGAQILSGFVEKSLLERRVSALEAANKGDQEAVQ